MSRNSGPFGILDDDEPKRKRTMRSISKKDLLKRLSSGYSAVKNPKAKPKKRANKFIHGTGKRSNLIVRAPTKDLMSMSESERRREILRKLEGEQFRLEAERIKNETTTPIEVDPKDRKKFEEAFIRTEQKVRDRLLHVLAPSDMAFNSGLEKALLDLNILTDAGVSATLSAMYTRLAEEISTIKLIELLCDIHKIDRSTRTKLIDARIEHLKPKTNPLAPDIVPRTGSPIGRGVKRSKDS